MKKHEITPHDGKTALYTRGTPNFKILQNQDYISVIGNLELEIRNYYKETNDSNDSNPSKPP